MINVRFIGMFVFGFLLFGKYFYLFSIGIGLVLFMSIIRDFFIYESFEKIILVYGMWWCFEFVY